jgi:hypothetical protein
MVEGWGLPVEEGHGKECLDRESVSEEAVILKGKLTTMKVPGRNSVVRKAMIFIAELSCLLAAASSLEYLARPMLTSVSACAMRLNSQKRYL